MIMDGVGVDLLDQRGLTRPGSRMPLAESFIGMVVRAGQPKPDISTMDALRKTLLAAKSIAYSDSSSGTYLSTIGFKKLGVAEEISGKTRKVRGPPSGELVAAVVARGEAEVGFQQVPELIHVPGVDFVGTVPSDIQPPTLFVGALPKNSQHPDAAIELLRFLSSAEADGHHESWVEAVGGALKLSLRPRQHVAPLPLHSSADVKAAIGTIADIPSCSAHVRFRG